MHRRKCLILFFAAVMMAVSFVVACNYVVGHRYAKYTLVSPEDVSPAQTVMILGARVFGDDVLSHVYEDRTLTALEIYRSGKAQKILISGDHGRKEYDEVNAAKDYLLERGVNGDDIFLDHAGFDTYDSMYRAREIFKVKSLIVVTQGFHLPRAVFIARELGLEAYGVSADKRVYAGALRNDVRESLARVKAALDILFHSKPKFLGEAVPITGDSRLSWD